MRQFRGIPIDGKDFVYGWYCWYYGHKICQENVENVNADDVFIEVIPETVGQNIIINGKEFYEGDVTKDDSDDIGVVRFGKLPLDKSGDCVCTYPAFYVQCFGQLGQASMYDCAQIGEWMEIIGTIHTTHPELKEKKE